MNVCLTHLRSWLVALLHLVPLVAVAQAQNEPVSRIVFIAGKIGAERLGQITDFAHVVVEGRIDARSPGALRAALDLARTRPDSYSFGGDPAVRVFLNSPGGSVVAAIAMGRLLRANAAEVWVDQEHTCASACILVLAGGVDRWAVPSSRLGIHRPYFEPSMFAGLSYADSQRKYRERAAEVRRYLVEMGVSDELFQLMLSVPSNGMKFLTTEAAEAFSLLGKDPAHEEWERARAGSRMGADFMRAQDRFIKCMNDGGTDRACSHHLTGGSTKR